MRKHTLIATALATAAAGLGVAGLAAADVITCTAGGTCRGTQGPDELTGTAVDDNIVAKKGDDSVAALEGNDVVNSGRGDDTVDGDEGDDTLKGKKGADTLDGDLGSDVIYAKGDGKKGGIDTVACGEDPGGADIDVVSVDKNDVLVTPADCETVKRPGKPAP